MTLLWFVSAAAAISFGLCWILLPLLRRVALAKPGSRSSHREPTPQGGGIAVIAATFLVTLAAVMASPEGVDWIGRLGLVILAALVLAILGAIDDVRPMPVLPRLILQVVAVGMIAASVPHAEALQAIGVPPAVQWFVVTLMGVWFVNLTNFIDGLDWLTVASFVPATATLAILGFLDVLNPADAIIAAALCGAVLGFAPLNRPVARLFLGDVGSLPMGLLLAYLLLRLAAEGHVVAALLIPAYSCADATLTLLRRAFRGEKVWQAHRSHFYQRATDHGFSVLEVSAHVFVLALFLSGLAIMTVVWSSFAVQAMALVIGGVAVASLLLRFSRPRRITAP